MFNSDEGRQITMTADEFMAALGQSKDVDDAIKLIEEVAETYRDHRPPEVIERERIRWTNQIRREGARIRAARRARKSKR